MALEPHQVVGLARAILQVDLDGLTRDLGKIDQAVPLALALPDDQALPAIEVLEPHVDAFSGAQAAVEQEVQASIFKPQAGVWRVRAGAGRFPSAPLVFGQWRGRLCGRGR